MNLFTYFGVTPEEFNERYVNTGLVMVNNHHDFPLSIYNYSRKCVQENVWDSVTSKCRGIIARRDNHEVIARPFEKFHNYGAEPGWGNTTFVPTDEPVVWEKIDGFMCTLYTWDGVDYFASKGSFHSTHAKWATAQLRKKWDQTMPFREEGYTYVFEGLCPDLRIVVNYKNRQELILLAIINNDTGEEFSPEQLQYVGRCTHFTTPELSDMLMKEVVHSTGITETQVADNGNIESKVVNEEGFVLTWYRPGQTPFRLKLKFIEYLRLHRLVTNVSPKHIWEVLSTGLTSEMDEYINNSTPGFAKFVQKWAKAMTAEYKRLATEATIRYVTVKETVRVKVGQRPYENLGTERKAWALEFQRPENKEFASILFAMLDGKNIEPIIWKQIKPMTKDANPLVNGFAY